MPIAGMPIAGVLSIYSTEIAVRSVEEQFFIYAAGWTIFPPSHAAPCIFQVSRHRAASVLDPAGPPPRVAEYLRVTGDRTAAECGLHLAALYG